MSSPDRFRRPVLALALLSLAALGACTVQPLYGQATPARAGAGAPIATELAFVAVAPVGDRVSQELRNHLIFLLSGGAGEPASPRYTVNLQVAAIDATSASIQVGRTADDPTASLVTVTANYTLTDAQGRTVARGVRSAQAPYDVSQQQFAAIRAQRNAQDRAAREAAEFVRLAIAQDLARLPPG